MSQPCKQTINFADSATPAPGAAYVGAFSCGGMVMVCLSVYHYGPTAKAAVNRDEPTWQKWMGERFPMPQG